MVVSCVFARGCIDVAFSRGVICDRKIRIAIFQEGNVALCQVLSKVLFGADM